MLAAIGLDEAHESAYRALVAVGAADVPDLARRLSLGEYDTETALVAEHACRNLATASAWSRAGSRGICDPQIAMAAQEVLRAVPAALPRICASRLCDAVAEFTDRYTERGRCPADDAISLDLSGDFL